ncbi:MAG: hypothetical protein QOH60_4679 [Mycobacterium sp.]|jgi:hypothetical protein|nr:hypothetical protein [Mycobacterium sp.]
MNRASATFLQVVIAVVAIGSLALMLGEPHMEGRNAHATLFEIYFKDPFLAFAYVASIPVFVAFYQALKVTGYAGRNEIFSPAAVKAVRAIKYCAIAVIGFAAASEIYIVLINTSDDRAGGVFIGALITVASGAIAAAAGMFERILQNAVDPKCRD